MTTPEPRQGDTPASDAPTSAQRRLQRAADDVSHTRTRATYVAWVVGVVASIVLLVFILVNLDRVDVDLVFATVNLPIGVVLLIAAIIGALITAALGGARIFQLSRALKKAGKRE